MSSKCCDFTVTTFNFRLGIELRIHECWSNMLIIFRNNADGLVNLWKI